MSKILVAGCALSLWLAATALLVEAQSDRQAEAQPEVFGAGVLSVGRVFRGSFAPDGRTFYFFKKIAEAKEDYRIFVSKLVNDRWTPPERVNLGGEYSDLYPSISKDGRRMVFSSYRPAPGDASPKANAHLWYVDRQGEGWGKPVFLSRVNRFGHYHSWVEFGPDNAIYFRVTTPDWRSNQTLFTRWDGKEYVEPQVYEVVAYWQKQRSDIRIVGGSPSPDGKVVFFDVGVREPGRQPQSDIWVSFHQGEGWSEPKPLGKAINSELFDVFPFFSPDGRTLYFVRDFATFYHLPLAAALASVR